MGKHYVCTGSCGGVAEMPTVCGAEGCDKHGKPLVECKCDDGAHAASARACQYCGEYCTDKGGCDLVPAE